MRIVRSLYIGHTKRFVKKNKKDSQSSLIQDSFNESFILCWLTCGMRIVRSLVRHTKQKQKIQKKYIYIYIPFMSETRLIRMWDMAYWRVWRGVGDNSTRDRRNNTLQHTATRYDTLPFECGQKRKCIIACCSVLQCVLVCCSVLYCAAVCCSVLWHIAVWCGVVQRVAMCYIVVQMRCDAVCCSVLQCVAVCCNVLQRVAVCYSVTTKKEKRTKFWRSHLAKGRVWNGSMVQCVAVCCSILKSHEKKSVLQFVIVCWSVLLRMRIETVYTWVFVRVFMCNLDGETWTDSEFLNATLQHTATHCNTLQHATIKWLIHTQTILAKHHAEALQHTATDCNRLQQTATDCNIVQHPAPQCTTLHHTAKHCTKLHTQCNTLHHTATYCTTLHKQSSRLQHTAPH